MEQSLKAKAAPVQNNPGLLTRLAYGVGGAAGGIKNNGFDYVLLIFYSQVLGLPAAMVGLALVIALVIDAVSDPTVGYWSDNIRTRIGRRHPFMYAAMAPVAIGYYFLWNPPADMSGGALFVWLLALTVLVRLMYTLFEVPGAALAAELSQDYDARTSLMSFRYFFAWVGGLSVQIALFALFLQPSENDPAGYFHIPGWNLYGAVGAIAIFGAIAVTTIGTHNHIPHLKAPPARRDLTSLRVLAEIWETISNPSFRALFIATLFGLIATGVSATLNQYINGFFWEFNGDQIAILTFAVYVSAILALIVAPLAGRMFGKKKAAIGLGLIAFTVAPAPVFARQLGLMPPNDPGEMWSPVFLIVLTITIFDLALIIAYQMLAASMVADIVEESELATGRRSEGIFFSGISFIRKLSQGVGVFTASAILAVAAITPGMKPQEASDASVYVLGWGYGLSLLALWMLMILSISFYKITRDSHEANLAALAARDGDEPNP